MRLKKIKLKTSSSVFFRPPADFPLNFLSRIAIPLYMDAICGSIIMDKFRYY